MTFWQWLCGKTGHDFEDSYLQSAPECFWCKFPNPNPLSDTKKSSGIDFSSAVPLLHAVKKHKQGESPKMDNEEVVDTANTSNETTEAADGTSAVDTSTDTTSNEVTTDGTDADDAIATETTEEDDSEDDEENEDDEEDDENDEGEDED